MILPTDRASAFPFSFPAAPTTAEAASIRIHGLSLRQALHERNGRLHHQTIGAGLLPGHDSPRRRAHGAGQPKGTSPLVKRFKETYPEKDLWCFSGYLFDKEILGHFAKIMPETMELLKYIDILVDGEFVLAKKISPFSSKALPTSGPSTCRNLSMQENCAFGIRATQVCQK